MADDTAASRSGIFWHGEPAANSVMGWLIFILDLGYVAASIAALFGWLEKRRSREQKKLRSLTDHVTFGFPAELVGAPAPSGHILGVAGAGWFTSILQGVEGLGPVTRTYQEDWGVCYEVEHGGRPFWVGVSSLRPHAWVAQVHARGFFPRRSKAGWQSLYALTRDLHRRLEADSRVSEVRWYTKEEMNGRRREGEAEPFMGAALRSVGGPQA